MKSLSHKEPDLGIETGFLETLILRSDCLKLISPCLNVTLTLVPTRLYHTFSNQAKPFESKHKASSAGKLPCSQSWANYWFLSDSASSPTDLRTALTAKDSVRTERHQMTTYSPADPLCPPLELSPHCLTPVTASQMQPCEVSLLRRVSVISHRCDKRT